jgi:hypothetical protein
MRRNRIPALTSMFMKLTEAAGALKSPSMLRVLLAHQFAKARSRCPAWRRVCAELLRPQPQPSPKSQEVKENPEAAATQRYVHAARRAKRDSSTDALHVIRAKFVALYVESVLNATEKVRRSLPRNHACAHVLTTSLSSLPLL